MAKRDTSSEVQTISASEVGTLEENLPGIIDPKTFSVPAVPNPYADDFGAFTSGLFLPRIQLEGSSSNFVKQRKVQAGNYVMVTGKDQFEILGESIDILVLTYRSKALDLTDKKNVVASFDKSSETFRSIVAASQQRSKGFLYGLEFLVYVPDSKGEVKFATLFMGNPTMRVEAKNFKPLIGKAATMKVKLIDNGEHVWEAPVILPCTTALANYPDQEQMAAQMQLFLEPPKGEVREEVPSDDAAAAGVAPEGGRDR